MARTHATAPPTVATNAPSSAPLPAPQPEALAKERDLAGAMFCDIASTAYTIKQLADLLESNSLETVADKDAVISSLEALAERVGMLADMGAVRCGRTALMGGLAEWTMLPTQPDVPKVQAMTEHQESAFGAPSIEAGPGGGAVHLPLENSPTGQYGRPDTDAAGDDLKQKYSHWRQNVRFGGGAV